MESRTSRYQSRILREMHQNTENPFNSPPSSTGSHGTVTITSDLSNGPEGESTRRMDDSIMLPSLSNKEGAQRTPFKVNTSAIGRNFPEWKGWNGNNREETEDIYDVTGDNMNFAKENMPPSSSTVASPSQVVKQRAVQGTFGTRAHMQARVEDESDFSGNMPGVHSTHRQSPNSNKTKPHASQPAWQPQRGNVTTLIQTLKAAQAAKEFTPKKPSPKSDSAERKSSSERHHFRFNNTYTSPATPNQTGRSFFLPNLVHINDFASGVLKYSSTTKDGIPVFVKHGKVHDQESKSSPGNHAEVDAIEIPKDEQEIFVSLDKIREEIHTLQAHDDQVTKQAEQLQEEVSELHIQLARFKSRKDSAVGSDSESSVVDYLNTQKSQLEEKVATLQGKLDKANRKISINEIHTESYVTERDEALKNATAHLDKIRSLEDELDATRRELNTARGGTQDIDMIESENRSLREDNIVTRQKYKDLLEENRSLRSHNTIVTEQNIELQQEVKRLQRLLASMQEERDSSQKEYEVVNEEKRTLLEDNLSLERHNDKFYNDNKSLQQKVALLERQVQDLQDNNAQLHQMLDVANAETGTVTFDIKDLKDRLEKKNGGLCQQNAQLQQQIFDLQVESASKRTAFDQEKRRLVLANERLRDQLDGIGNQFEQIIRESKKEVAKYEEKQSSLTQQLRDIADREAALASQLEQNAGKESALQEQIRRRNTAVEEARRITKEIQAIQTTTTKTKPVKVTRIVEPTTSKSRSVFSEMSARSTTSQTDLQIQDDYMQQIDMSQGSDLDVFPRAEMDKLREALRHAKLESRTQDLTEEYVEDEEAEAAITDDVSQSLPPTFKAQAQRNENISRNAESATTKRQPLGILKNTQPAQRVTAEPDLTGRFSVKSAMSGMSIPSQVTGSNISHGRRHSDSARFNFDAEENMTSALFIDDITLESRRRAAAKEKPKTKKAIPTLSKEAKRVLDSLCQDHDCRNCIVCTRINSHQHENDTTRDGTNKKKTIIVEKPVAVTDRIPNPVAAASDTDYEDQHTMRPAQDPGVALATVLKSLRDEVAHLTSAVAKKQAEYNAIDASFGRRQRKAVSAELTRLMRMLELKNDQIYKLHDVLEGQKSSGQEMNEEQVELTLMSIRTADDTWYGILD